MNFIQKECCVCCIKVPQFIVIFIQKNSCQIIDAYKFSLNSKWETSQEQPRKFIYVQ